MPKVTLQETKLTWHPNKFKNYCMQHKTIKLITNSSTAYQILAKVDKLYFALKWCKRCRFSYIRERVVDRHTYNYLLSYLLNYLPGYRDHESTWRRCVAKSTENRWCGAAAAALWTSNWHVLFLLRVDQLLAARGGRPRGRRCLRYLRRLLSDWTGGRRGSRDAVVSSRWTWAGDADRLNGWLVSRRRGNFTASGSRWRGSKWTAVRTWPFRHLSTSQLTKGAELDTQPTGAAVKMWYMRHGAYAVVEHHNIWKDQTGSTLGG